MNLLPDRIGHTGGVKRPAQECFVELTTADQRLVTRKNAKIRRLRQLYPDVGLVVVYQRDFRALLVRNGLDPRRLRAA